jgi:hypothetical protein
MDRESIVMVAEDLEYLASWPGDITDPEIRRGTATLRRLLDEDAYGAAWRAIGRKKQPTLMAVDLDLMLGGRVDTVVIALACGADFRGMKSVAICMNSGSVPLGTAPPTPIREGGYPFEQVFTLSEYLKSTSGVVDGRRFSRHDVIKYLANVKGGVHLNSQERKKEKLLIDRIGKAEKRFTFHTTDGLLVEAVAIAQSLGGSAEAKSLIAAVKGI